MIPCHLIPWLFDLINTNASSYRLNMTTILSISPDKTHTPHIYIHLYSPEKICICRTWFTFGIGTARRILRYAMMVSLLALLFFFLIKAGLHHGYFFLLPLVRFSREELGGTEKGGARRRRGANCRREGGLRKRESERKRNTIPTPRC